MFVSAGIYQSIFEEAFLRKSTDFYKNRTDEKLTSLNVKDYVSFARAVIQIES